MQQRPRTAGSGMLRNPSIRPPNVVLPALETLGHSRPRLTAPVPLQPAVRPPRAHTTCAPCLTFRAAPISYFPLAAFLFLSYTPRPSWPAFLSTQARTRGNRGPSQPYRHRPLLKSLTRGSCAVAATKDCFQAAHSALAGYPWLGSVAGGTRPLRPHPCLVAPLRGKRRTRPRCAARTLACLTILMQGLLLLSGRIGRGHVLKAPLAASFWRALMLSL